MHSYAKSPDLIAATTEMVATHIGYPEFLAAHLLKAADELATTPNAPKVFSRIYIEEDEFLTPEQKGESSTGISKNHAKSIYDCFDLDYETYLYAVRRILSDSVERETVHAAANARMKYADFKEPIEDLRHSISRGEAKLLGQGSNVNAYLLEADQSLYAVRVPLEDSPKHTDEVGVFDVVQFHGGMELYNITLTALAALNLARGQGIPNLEQLVAYSPADNIVVSTRMPGKTIATLDNDDIASISEKQIFQFVDTMKSMSERGLMIDPNPNNVFWDSEQGFSIIDPIQSTLPEFLETGVDTLVVGLMCGKQSIARGERKISAVKRKRAMPLLEILDQYSTDILKVRPSFNPQRIEDRLWRIPNYDPNGWGIAVNQTRVIELPIA